MDKRNFARSCEGYRPYSFANRLTQYPLQSEDGCSGVVRTWRSTCFVSSFLAKAFLLCAVSLILRGICQAQYPNKVIYGSAKNQGIGGVIVGGADFQQNGTKDIAAGIYSAVNIYSSSTGGLLTTLNGATTGDAYGAALALPGDLNGDGYPDLLVSAHSFCGQSLGAYVRAVSGKDWSTLYTVSGSTNDQFGLPLAVIGDIDGDGKADFIVGANNAHPQFTNDCNSVGKGQITVYSGATGSGIWGAEGDNYGDAFGFGAGGVGDVDGDGVPDYAANSFLDHSVPGVINGAYLRVFSGKTGNPLYTLRAASGSVTSGNAIFPLADVDGDGYDDFIIAGTYSDTGTDNQRGAVQLRSGHTGRIIWTVTGDNAGDYFGSSASPLGDVDGDGVPDIIVGSSSSSGYAKIISGKTGTVLRTITSNISADGFARSVAGVGDINGDGKMDFAIGAPFDSLKYSGAGSVRIFYGPSGSPFWIPPPWWSMLPTKMLLQGAVGP